MVKIVIPLIVTTVQCFAASAQTWQVRPEVSQMAAKIISKRMSQPHNYIPQSQDGEFKKLRSSMKNQFQTTIVDNDEGAVELIEETYRQLSNDQKLNFTPQEVDAVLSHQAPLISFLGLANGLIQLPDFYNVLKTYLNTNKMPFEQVMAHLSSDMENDFDVFILINSSEEDTKKDLFPKGQRIKYFRRTAPGVPVFVRDEAGQIIGVNASEVGQSIQTESELATYVNETVQQKAMDSEGILTSTGVPGSGGMKTFSGIYRLGRTQQAHGKGMIYTMFIDYTYLLDPNTVGKNSGLAIHGTPPSNVRHLGKRASHGCARIEPNLAGVWRSLMLNRTLKPGDPHTGGIVKFPQKEDWWNLHKEDLMDFNRHTQVPSPEEQIKLPTKTRPGYKALMILFDGYEKQGTSL